MGTIASQITSLTIVYSTVYSDADQRKYQSSASLAFVRGIHRRPVNSPHKWPVLRKLFPFDDVIITRVWLTQRSLVLHVSISGQGHHWFRLWTVACMASRVYLNQRSHIANSNLMNKRIKFWSNTVIFHPHKKLWRSHHYDDVIMTTIASQITSLTVVYSIVYSSVDQRKHQSSASLAFVRGIHRRPVNSPHKWPVLRKLFPFDDVIITRVWLTQRSLVLHVSISGQRHHWFRLWIVDCLTPTVTYCQFQLNEKKRIKFWSKRSDFLFTQKVLKKSSTNWGPFCPCSSVWNIIW